MPNQTRRSFIASALGLLAAPAIVRVGSLMKVSAPEYCWQPAMDPAVRHFLEADPWPRPRDGYVVYSGRRYRIFNEEFMRGLQT